MSLAARKSDAKNHVSRSKKSGGTNTMLNGPPHAEDTSIPRIDAGQGLPENMGDKWTEAEMKMLSP
jgi:hypothetical protein